MNAQAVVLLKRALVRLQLLNGPPSKCVCASPEQCPNHRLISDIEDFLQVGDALNDSPRTR